jgi:hypothetical protein
MKPFYFIHIGKTGGISIRKALSEAAIASGISEDEIAIHENETNTLERRKGKKIVAGHIRWDHNRDDVKLYSFAVSLFKDRYE